MRAWLPLNFLLGFQYSKVFSRSLSLARDIEIQEVTNIFRQVKLQSGKNSTNLYIVMNLLPLL